MSVTAIRSSGAPTLRYDLAVRTYSGDTGINLANTGSRIELSGTARGEAATAVQRNTISVIIDQPVTAAASIAPRKGQTAQEIAVGLAAMLSAGGIFSTLIEQRGAVTVVHIGTEQVGAQLQAIRTSARNMMPPFSEASHAYVDAFGASYQEAMRRTPQVGTERVVGAACAATMAARAGSLAAMQKLGSLAMFVPSLVGADVATAVGKLALTQRK